MCINTHSSERMPRDFLIKYIESNSGEWMKTGTRADLHISGEWNTKRSNTHGRAEFTFVNGHDSNGKLTKIWKDKWRLPGNLLVRRYKKHGQEWTESNWTMPPRTEDTGHPLHILAAYQRKSNDLTWQDSQDMMSNLEMQMTFKHPSLNNKLSTWVY